MPAHSTLGPSPDATLLILDLDETLVYATETPLDRQPDFTIERYSVYRRPWLDEFLAEMQEHFDLAVWSSASDRYVDAVVDRIFPDRSKLRFVWGRSRATRRAAYDGSPYLADPWDHLSYVKPLSKVKRAGWRLERVLIVDDTPDKCVQNFGNAVYPRPYEGASNDDELRLLARYLKSIKGEPNVRLFEKRRWRDEARQMLNQ